MTSLNTMASHVVQQSFNASVATAGDGTSVATTHATSSSSTAAMSSSSTRALLSLETNDLRRIQQQQLNKKGNSNNNAEKARYLH